MPLSMGSYTLPFLQAHSCLFIFHAHSCSLSGQEQQFKGRLTAKALPHGVVGRYVRWDDQGC